MDVSVVNIPDPPPPPAAALQTEQETFGKSLEKLDKVVAGFGKHQDVSRTKEVAAEVKRLQDELKSASRDPRSHPHIPHIHRSSGSRTS